MKKIYIQFLLLLLVSTFSIDLQAQRLSIPEKSTIGDEFLIAPDGTYSELKPILAGRCSGCEIPDLDIRDNSSNWSNSFDAAALNETLIRRAAKKKLKKWYNRQVNEIVKPAIDKKFGRTFSSFNEAKNELLIDSERRNIVTFSRPLRDKYSRLRTRGFKAKEKHLKELKLLKLREAEIKSGNINNPSLGYTKVQGVYLKDIRSLNSLKSKWTPLFDDFSKNIAETHINNHMYKSIGRGVESEVTKLKNQHYNSLNTWDRLSLLQFLVHYEEYKKLSSPPYLIPEHINNMFKKFNNIDKATPELIENLSIKNRTGGFSVFDGRTYYKLLSAYTSPPALPGGEYMAKMEWERLKNQALDKLLNSTSTADFAITNLIGELNITNNTQKNWLYKNKTAANKLIKFIDNNKVNNKVTDKAKNFAVEAIISLMNNYIKLDINKLIEVLKFEQDYKNRMSSSEKVIFESISRNNQLGYLFNAQKAIWKAEELFPNSLYNGKGDAFRHAYFNGLNAILLGNTLAESLATAHEDRTAPVGYSNYYKEKQMDLFNNQIGRDRKNWLFDGYSSLTKSILDALKTGKLRYLSNLKGGAASGRATNLSKLTPTNK
ncbi:hypothetical protein CSC81_04475 [Tenacibaculum discolor]|uniref:DUF6973 domain-containing protein n=1 Tax=Tenacibaculum discolor TaxID=361581 RepID=A0A2G1BXQ1_9FLAO|nr:hypothetical protein [Tenacibaculum discolor]MDP2542893.1 hypothetical protein [Tenacibaculum discolor]PHN98754.1 hypothetical protein CSC81_04475 [Tenacibaculum discolor]PHO00030.1 hypothetical protein CSC82_30950 [Rhodobacteraceae bacterium 4F10]